MEPFEGPTPTFQERGFPHNADPDGLASGIAAANKQDPLIGPTADRRVWEIQRYREHQLAVGNQANYTRTFRSGPLQFYPERSPAEAVDQ